MTAAGGAEGVVFVLTLLISGVKSTSSVGLRPVYLYIVCKMWNYRQNTGNGDCLGLQGNQQVKGSVEIRQGSAVVACGG